MLFLVKSEAKIAPPLPPQQLMEFAVKTWELAISHKQKGKILAGGGLAHGRGCCEIWNVDSTEELHTLLTQAPLSPFLEFEIIPLTTPEYVLEWCKRALASLRASK